MLMQALDAGDLMLVEKDYVQSLFDTITDLRSPSRNPEGNG